MPSHTPEPWIYVTDGVPVQLKAVDYNYATGCVNGCAGLNPAAYRACVEALKNIAESTTVPDKREWAFIQAEAIDLMKHAHAQEPT